MKTIKGYKGFDKDMKCRGFQYEVGKDYEEPKAVICESGFHFCENPFDILSYYDLCDTEFAEVEAVGKTVGHNEDSKHSTTKIKIIAKLNFAGFVKASVEFLLKTTKLSKKTAASGDSSQLAASGDYSQLAASGYSSKLAASGDSSQLAASGDSSQLAASGYYSKLAASGYHSKLAASGDYSQLAASGDHSKLAASGDSSQLAASGDYSQLAASGDSSQLAASGDYSQLELNGEKCVGANIGCNGQIKGKVNCWITLAEYDDNGEVKCVKSAQIDGKKIKADTFYMLKDKKFAEVK